MKGKKMVPGFMKSKGSVAKGATKAEKPMVKPKSKKK